MFQATEAISRELKKDADLKVFTEEGEKSSRVWLQFGIKNGGSYRIQFISRDEGNDVALRVFGLVKIDEAKREKILPVLNQLNSQYRFVKFALDDDGDINLEYDYLNSAPDPAASAREILIRVVKIVDSAYPELMRAMWS